MAEQLINNKPNQLGDNIWVLEEAYGYAVQLEPYQGVKKGKQVAPSAKWAVRENVVLRLMNIYE